MIHWIPVDKTDHEWTAAKEIFWRAFKMRPLLKNSIALTKQEEKIFACQIVVNLSYKFVNFKMTSEGDGIRQP